MTHSTMRAGILIVCFLIAFVPGHVLSATRASESDVHIVIDASNHEPLPEIFRPGLALEGRGWPWLYYESENPVLKKFENDVGFKGTFRNYIWLDKTDFGSQGHVRFEDYLPWLKKVHENRGRLIISVIGMPRWLSSCREQCDDWNMESKWAMSPPYSYNKYEDLIYKIIKFYSVDNGLNSAYYEVWAEPDHPGYWRGSEKEYLKLYGAFSKAVVHIREKFGVDIKVGGPGTMSWNGYRDGAGMEADEDSLNKAMVFQLIDYCSRNALPLDFISFHRYDNDSKYHSIHRVGDFIRAKLRKVSLNHKIPLIVTEWNFYLDNVERNNEKGASFIPAALYDMDNAGLDYHTFFSLQDFGGLDISPGSLGLFTRLGIAKPSYNAFVMLSKLGDVRLRTSIDDDQNIGAIATISNKEKMAVLIWNYAQLDDVKTLKRALTHDPTLGRYFRNLPQNQKDEIIEWIRSSAEKQSGGVSKGNRNRQAGDLGLSREMTDKLPSYVRKYTSSLRAKHLPISVTIGFKNLGFKKSFRYQRWVINADHSNGFEKNLQFLKEIKLMILQESADGIKHEGHSSQDINRFMPLLEQYISELQEVKLAEAKKTRERISELPSEQKEKVKLVTKRFDEKMNSEPVIRRLMNLYQGKALALNNLASVKLQLVEENRVSLDNILDWRMKVAPYSVNLIILE